MYEKIEIETAGGCNKSLRILITLLDLSPIISSPQLQLHTFLIEIKHQLHIFRHTASNATRIIFACVFSPTKGITIIVTQISIYLTELQLSGN